MSRKFCLRLLSLGLLQGCLLTSPFPQTNPSPGLETALRGWNLYTWKDQGLYRWALLPATNALTDLLRAHSESQTGWGTLAQRLRKLARGQEIFWNFGVTQISFLQMALPPAAEQRQICQQAFERGLKLQVDPDMSPIRECLP